MINRYFFFFFGIQKRKNTFQRKILCGMIPLLFALDIIVQSSSHMFQIFCSHLTKQRDYNVEKMEIREIDRNSKTNSCDVNGLGGWGRWIDETTWDFAQFEIRDLMNAVQRT